MANSSHIPVTGLHEVRPEPPSKGGNGNLRAVTPSQTNGHDGGAPQTNGTPLGPRKLVRPSLAEHALRPRSSRGESPLLAHNAAIPSAPSGDHESSHAEAFYFQKQVQTQTLMAFVLEDGECIEGYIEWHDRNAIKVKNGSRMLIYKSSIKYLYKVGETQG
jgi:sRNA-binding regulator protein Hfq